MANQFLTACEQAINAAAGRDLSEDEMEKLVGDMESTIHRMRSEDAGLSMEDAALKAANELGNQDRLAKVIEARNKVINQRVYLQQKAFLKNSFPDRPDLGLSAMISGRNEARTGSRSSAFIEQRQLRDKYLSGLNYDLEKAGVSKLFASGEIDADVADAMWKLGNGDDVSGLNTHAVDIAKTINKWQEAARIDSNKSGAWIRKLPGYIARQSHDMLKLREAGFEAWRDNILPKLDQSTFDGIKDKNEFLHNVYIGLASGVHLKTETPDWLTGFKGSPNKARAISQERVLHFKDGLSWHEYNKQFGTGNVRESIYSGLESSARSTGLMRKFGTNPENMINKLAHDAQEEIRSTGNVKALSAFTDSFSKIMKNEYSEVAGLSNIPGSYMMARYAAGARALDSMVKLGGSTISSFNDLPSQALEMRYQGKSYFSALSEAISGKFSRLTSEESKKVAQSIGVYADAMTKEIAHRFSGDMSMPGKISRLQRKFFKLNLLNWWTESGRQSHAFMTSNWLAENAKSDYSSLNSDLKRALDLHAIGENEWNLYRKMDMETADEKQYMVPESTDSLRREDLEQYVIDKGLKATDTSVEAARNELTDKLRGYILDRTLVGMTEPTSRTQALLNQGTNPGTVIGEAARFVGQYKSFTVSFMQQSLGREIFGRGYTPAALGESRFNSLANALKNGNGELSGVAQVVLWATMFGYLSLQSKLLLRGQTPRPASLGTLNASFLQGGGMGILGDFMFGETNRFGSGPVVSALGPMIGNVDDIVRLYQDAVHGDAKAGDFLRFTVDHTPFINLFYTRPLLNYLFLNRLQESLSPGSLERYQQSVQQQQGNTFLMPPSQFMLGI